MKTYTLGYEGIGIDAYAQILCAAKVGLVIDVREKAWSYKTDFVKSVLHKALLAKQIDYYHLPSAGNPSANRKTAPSVEVCLNRYRSHLEQNPECLSELLTLIRRAHRAGRPACLTCYEHQPTQCHRSILLELLQVRAPRLRVIHLPLEVNSRLELLEQQRLPLGIP